MNGPAAVWSKVVQTTNDGDWEGLGACLASNAVQYHATQGLGGTAIQFNGRAEIIAGHRRAFEEMGLRWETVGLSEAENLVTGLVRMHFANGREGLAAMVARFDDAGLVLEIYSYVNRLIG